MSNKLTGAKKAAFLERMAKGRRKAKRSNPTAKKKKAPHTNKRSAPKKQARKKANGKLTGAKKAAFLLRMAKGRKKAKTSGKKANPAHAKRRNDEGMDAAAKQFERFHGKQPGRIIELEQVYQYPAEYAELGKLKELRFELDAANKDFPLTQFGACQAVCTPDGSNIYFLGGDQAVDFEALDIASDKDFVELGPCTYICYHTVKGFHDFTPTNYWHRFGEEDGLRPLLTYDRLNKTLFLISGNYRVRPEGIVN